MLSIVGAECQCAVTGKGNWFDNDGLHEVAYEETDHYSITRDFLNNYEKRLQQLFS